MPISTNEETTSPDQASRPKFWKLFKSSKSEAETQTPQLSLLRHVFLVATVTSAQLISLAGIGQALAPINIVASYFGDAGTGKETWYIAGFSLTVGTFIISAGRFGDMYGHRNMFMLGFSFVSLWSLLAGMSYYSNGIFFSFCRGMQGIGVAFLIPNGLAILGRTYPPGPSRLVAFSVFGSATPSGFMLGAVFSSIFAQYTKWAWAYWSFAIATAFLTAVAWAVIPADGPPPENQHFDFFGAFTGISGLVLINFAWNQAPIVGWNEPYVYFLLIIGVLLMVAFVFVELKVTEPLVPLKEISPSIIRVLVGMSFGWAAFGIWIFYFWQFMLQIRKESPLHVCAQFSPVSLVGIVAAGINVLLSVKGVPTSVLMVLAMIGFCVPSVLLATTPVHQTYWAQTFVGLLIAPFGLEISFPSATIMMSNAVPRHRQGIAASLVATVVNYSISIGLGIAGTVVTHTSPGQGPDELLSGVRSASYLGIGLSAAGILIALYGVLEDQWKQAYTHWIVEKWDQRRSEWAMDREEWRGRLTLWRMKCYFWK